MKNKELLDFYKQTSLYTDLGFYKDFVMNLPDDIRKLCLLQRYQTIHPIDLKGMRNKKDTFYGDLTKIPFDRLNFENDLFPTAQSIFAELLRRNSNYTLNRCEKDKVNICCREQALMLVSTLKAKGIPCRCRSGFANYIYNDNVNYDHWITEYYDKSKNRWVLVDADVCCSNPDLNPYDIPRSKFLFGAEAYLGMRNKKYKDNEIYYASDPATLGLKAAIRGLFYDFHCLMNNEIIFLHQPKYIVDKDFILDEEEYLELDELALLLLEPDQNFEKIQYIWDNNSKFRIMAGGLN